MYLGCGGINDHSPARSDFRPVPATGARNQLFDEVWDDLLAIAETARTICRSGPGFSADFRLGGDTHREIIATAFLEKLQLHATAATFIAYSMPAARPASSMIG